MVTFSHRKHGSKIFDLSGYVSSENSDCLVYDGDERNGTHCVYAWKLDNKHGPGPDYADWTYYVGEAHDATQRIEEDYLEGARFTSKWVEAHVSGQQDVSDILLRLDLLLLGLPSEEVAKKVEEKITRIYASKYSHRLVRGSKFSNIEGIDYDNILRSSTLQ